MFIASYTDAWRHLNEATERSDINTTDAEQQEPLDRGHRKKNSNQRYSPYKRNQTSVERHYVAETAEEDSSDSNEESISHTQSVLPNITVPGHLSGTLSIDSMEPG